MKCFARALGGAAFLPGLLVALLLALPGGSAAQAADPLKSPACAEALARLEAARATDARGSGVTALREQAAQACLGGGVATDRRARVLQPPVAVRPPTIVPAVPPAAVTVPPRLPAPPVAIARPATPTHCDAGGCWADDGAGLRHLGPNLAGPNGSCTQHAGQVACH